jgi:hypothetical protein
MSEIVQVKLTTRTSSGTLIRSPATLEYADGRIYFLKSPFSLKDEIKAMGGSRWHGYDEEDGRKIWSVEDSQRNRFQLGFLMGEDVYAWFNRELEHFDYSGLMLNGTLTPPMPHQCDMADHFLTYHYGVKAAEMGVGKTLSAQLVIQKSGVRHWWWVGPKSSLPNIRREFRKWGFSFDTGDIHIEMMTYEELTRRMDEWKPGDPVPSRRDLRRVLAAKGCHEPTHTCRPNAGQPDPRQVRIRWLRHRDVRYAVAQVSHRLVVAD